VSIGRRAKRPARRGLGDLVSNSKEGRWQRIGFTLTDRRHKKSGTPHLPPAAGSGLGLGYTSKVGPSGEGLSLGYTSKVGPSEDGEGSAGLGE